MAKGIKLSLSNVLTMVLVSSLVIISVFLWSYARGSNPIEALMPTFTNERPVPEYLFTIYEANNKRLSSPSSTTVINGNIYVTDSLNGRVVVFKNNGKFVQEFGKTGEGKLKFPFNLILVDNQIFVSDLGTRKIHVFDINGKFLNYYGEKLYKLPSAIFYRSNRVYILDVNQSAVIVADKGGKQLLKFGGRGHKDGEFYYPFSLYVTDANQSYVADANNRRIQVFDQQGRVLKVLTGKDANGGSGLDTPRGLAFDKAGNLYTTELMGPGLAVLDNDGRVILRSSGAEPEVNGQTDRIQYGTAVFIDDKQRLYLTEFGNSRILVYALK